MNKLKLYIYSYFFSILLIFSESSYDIQSCITNGYPPGSVACSFCDILEEELVPHTEEELSVVSECRDCCSRMLDIKLPVKYRKVRMLHLQPRGGGEFGGTKEWIETRSKNYPSLDIYESHTSDNPTLELSDPVFLSENQAKNQAGNHEDFVPNSLKVVIVDISSWKVDEIDEFLERKWIRPG